MPVDPVSLTIAIVALLTTIVSHIRHSECSNCMKIDMKPD